MTHDEKMKSLPEPPTEPSNDELNTELAELSLRANAALVGLGAVPDNRPLPDRVRDAVGEFGIALGSQKSVVNTNALAAPTHGESALVQPRLVRRFRVWCRKRRCESRLRRNVCPLCNSDAPRLDRCSVCNGSREYPLSERTKEEYRENFYGIDW